MNRDHYYRLKTLVEFEIDRFRETIKRLSASHFPSGVAARLIDELLNYLDERESRLSEIASIFEIDPKGVQAIVFVLNTVS